MGSDRAGDRILLWSFSDLPGGGTSPWRGMVDHRGGDRMYGADSRKISSGYFGSGPGRRHRRNGLKMKAKIKLWEAALYAACGAIAILEFT